MRKNMTEIVFILDRSGSMSGLETDSIRFRLLSKDCAVVLGWITLMIRMMSSIIRTDRNAALLHKVVMVIKMIHFAAAFMILIFM